MYESKCILPLRDIVYYVLKLTLLECTQSADNLFHSGLEVKCHEVVIGVK